MSSVGLLKSEKLILNIEISNNNPLLLWLVSFSRSVSQNVRIYHVLCEQPALRKGRQEVLHTSQQVLQYAHQTDVDHWLY